MAETDVDVVEIVSAAIEAERAGHKFYVRLADSTSDPKGKHMFNRLANDELAHIYWLMTVRQSLVKTGTCEVCRGDIHKIKVPITDPAEFLFPSAGITADVIKADSGEVDAIKQGIEIEEKAVAFYSESAKRIDDPDAKELFRKLADWEDGHRRLLQAEYDYVTNTGFYFGIAEFEVEGPDYLSWWRR
jgi:rubrerythrin